MKRVLIFRLLSIGYFISILSLFFYSFTQIDLGLTLTRWSPWQVAQKFFQSIGYFNRPLSTIFYIAIVLLFFIFYLLFLFLAHKKKFTLRQFWTLIIPLSLILGFSYNAFSYDLFNYIFDAKIVTFYNQNPYFHKALDFPNDPMLAFMHWTHRIYPYGPVWLAITVPLSYVGLQVFLLTFFLFKSIAVLSFIGTAFFIGKIVKKIKPENELFSLVLFGLNPLVIIETLVSGHNDSTMMFFSVVAFYLLLNKKYLFAFVVLFLSIGVKFATLVLLPIFIASLVFHKQEKELQWDKIWFFSMILMISTIISASIRTNFQPWYLLFILPFTALFGKKYFILIPTIVISLFSLLQYAPFLYLGNWDRPVPLILYWLTLGSILLSLALTLPYFLKSIVKTK